MKQNPPNRHAFPPTKSSRRSLLATASASALGAAVLNRPLVLLAAPVASTAANSKVNLALVGCGGQGCSDMRSLLPCGVNVVAFCDPDSAQIEKARAHAQHPTHKMADVNDLAGFWEASMPTLGCAE